MSACAPRPSNALLTSANVNINNNSVNSIPINNDHVISSTSAQSQTTISQFRAQAVKTESNCFPFFIFPTDVIASVSQE